MNAEIYAIQHDGPTVQSMEDADCAQKCEAAMYLARTGAASVVAIVANYANDVMAIRAAGNVRRANATRSFIATLARADSAIARAEGR